MIKAIVRYGYTLEEITEILPYEDMTDFSLASVFTNFDITYTIGLTSLITDLFKKVINKYSKSYIFVVNKEYVGDIEYLTGKVREWLVKFLNLYEDTKSRYETLIGLYNANLSKLLDQVEATSENEVFFNDTPQNSGGVFDSTDYTTNYTKTKNTSKSDIKPLIERIKDIQDNLKDIWREWLTDFERIFLEFSDEVEEA